MAQETPQETPREAPQETPQEPRQGPLQDPPQETPREAPRRFGKCRLVKRLGHGATAVVFLAKHEVLEMPVAVKVLRKRLSETRPDFAERFLREARMAARLDHPNIVRVFDCGVEDGYHYMVMDYVDGPNCQEKLEGQQDPMSWREAADIIRQVAGGLASAAARGIIHRDVKPSNIMIDAGGRARICDLGLAKLTMKGMAGLTQELHTVGTPNYMSPEQISSPSNLDLRADIYSLGATFYHMVCARPPFCGENPMKVVAQHLTAPLTPPIERNSKLPASVSSLICKMMAKSADERYQTYEDLGRDLENLLAGREVGAAGFSDTQSILMDDSELQEVLGELDFGKGLEIEIGEVGEDSLDHAADASSKSTTAGRSTVYTFSAADMAAYKPPPKARETREQAYRAHRRGTNKALVTVTIVLGSLLILALMMIVGFILFPS